MAMDGLLCLSNSSIIDIITYIHKIHTVIATSSTNPLSYFIRELLRESGYDSVQLDSSLTVPIPNTRYHHLVPHLDQSQCPYLKIYQLILEFYYTSLLNPDFCSSVSLSMIFIVFSDTPTCLMVDSKVSQIIFLVLGMIRRQEWSRYTS